MKLVIFYACCAQQLFHLKEMFSNGGQKMQYRSTLIEYLLMSILQSPFLEPPYFTKKTIPPHHAIWLSLCIRTQKIVFDIPDKKKNGKQKRKDHHF